VAGQNGVGIVVETNSLLFAIGDRAIVSLAGYERTKEQPMAAAIHHKTHREETDENQQGEFAIYRRGAHRRGLRLAGMGAGVRLRVS